jgi:hypothetical protein
METSYVLGNVEGLTSDFLGFGKHAKENRELKTDKKKAQTEKIRGKTQARITKANAKGTKANAHLAMAQNGSGGSIFDTLQGALGGILGGSSQNTSADLPADPAAAANSGADGSTEKWYEKKGVLIGGGAATIIAIIALIYFLKNK